MTQSTENRQEKARFPQNNKTKSKMKTLERILVLAGSMLLGFCTMKEALAIHPFLGGVILVLQSVHLYI